MRMILLAALAVVSLSSVAQAQNAPVTRLRDCINNTESGIPAPTSKHPNPKWLYYYVFMRAPLNPGIVGNHTYGSSSSWIIAGNLKQACDAAMSDFSKDPENKGWAITGASMQLIPDSVITQGLAH